MEMGNWVIRAIYPQGGHTVKMENIPESFTNKREAESTAEMLNARKKDANVYYLAVEDK